mgnify:CR=1 FL=1
MTTLVDYFAAHALEGITRHLGPAEDAAAAAYQYALAMMQERRKVSGSLKRPDDEIDAQLDHDTDHKEAEWLAK